MVFDRRGGFVGDETGQGDGEAGRSAGRRGRLPGGVVHQIQMVEPEPDPFENLHPGVAGKLIRLSSTISYYNRAVSEVGTIDNLTSRKYEKEGYRICWWKLIIWVQ